MNSAAGMASPCLFEREIMAYVAAVAGGKPLNISWISYENDLGKVEKLLLLYAFKQILNAAGVRS